jgi:dienelactone hydrolase
MPKYNALVSQFAAAALLCGTAFGIADEVPGSKPLQLQGNIAAQMVAGIDAYLMREIEAASKSGEQSWKVDSSTLDAYSRSVEPNRSRLERLLGVVDQRISPVSMDFVGEGSKSAIVAETKSYRVYSVRWNVLPGIDGEGLLVEPVQKSQASVIAIPDADQTPEMILGLAPGIPAEAQFARHLAENHCRVVIPVLIDRKETWSGNALLGRKTNISHREFVWRMAYEMGRHIIGYEVQKVLAAIDWLKSQDSRNPVGIFGYGEGGLIAMYAGALDARLKCTVVSGVGHETRMDTWKEPIERNVWAALPEFRDEHLRKLFGGGRLLIYEQSIPPIFEIPSSPERKQAAPGRLTLTAEREAEFKKQRGNEVIDLHESGQQDARSAWYVKKPPQGRFGDINTVKEFLIQLGLNALADTGSATKDTRESFDSTHRQKRQFDQLVTYTQRLWRLSEPIRKQYWSKADATSPQKWERSCEAYREHLWTEVIGKLPNQTAPLNPRTRLAYETPKWKGYEVVLDLYPDVFAYGILLMPKDLKPGEKRPVVVCQHGLEGRPQDVVEPKKRTPYYNSFGAQLADMGYIVYAPQNPYIGQDKFRILLRKSHPLRLSLYAFIVRQHETATDWLASLPNADAEKIAFYGLSYGGKTAMRIPSLVKRYCLSICAGDFNEWIGKNVSIDFHNSYMWTFEYDMYEFNLGHTYNYAEMAFLIAPRPFMVERGHDDGVGIDELVAYEYAKVRYLYANRLKLPQNAAIEFTPGGHEVFLRDTARFLKQHTGWPK